MKKKGLIAYYSRAGQNYVSGKILDLPFGNTEVVAQKIQELTGSDLFEIRTVKNYPKDYTETTNVSRDELHAGARPQLAETLDDLAGYDVIYLGYPNWWGTFPMAVATFLESCDFSGKTIVPFCTHEGSGLGNSERDIQKLCPAAKVKDGLAIRGGNVQSSKEAVVKWLSNFE